MKKINKAERIYKQTRYDCMQHISTWGYIAVNSDSKVSQKENKQVVH